MARITPEFVEGAAVVLEDMAETARRFARDFDRLALLVRSLSPPPGGVVDIRFPRRSRRI
jgi:hypothetical protein